MISVYLFPLHPYLSFSDGLATVGTHSYYVTGGHHGNKSPPTPSPGCRASDYSRQHKIQKAWWDGRASKQMTRSWEQRAKCTNTQCELLVLFNLKRCMRKHIWISSGQTLIIGIISAASTETMQSRTDICTSLFRCSVLFTFMRLVRTTLGPNPKPNTCHKPITHCKQLSQCH